MFSFLDGLCVSFEMCSVIIIIIVIAVDVVYGIG